MKASFVARIDAVPAAAWDALEGAANPFLRHAFLAALEASGSTDADSGWQPHHLLLHQGTRLVAAMPAYLKAHSWGEYVFDWAWADAYARHGIAYYPKLLCAVPFTPVTGPRLLRAPEIDPQEALGHALRALDAEVRGRALSSWHLLFPDSGLAAGCDEAGLLRREGVQFHWHNRGYRDFEDFLDGFASRKRKQLKRERREIATRGLEVERIPGTAIDAALWDCFHGFYQLTYAKRSGHGGYLSREFFHRLGASMPESLLLVVARRAGRPIAAALDLVGGDALYGRYWGASEEHAHLHFELCYYQGIEYCIERGLKRFDAGAQGEHKLARGFEPVLTTSFHRIAHPAFNDAIADFLRRERVANAHYLEGARAALPFRQCGD